MRADCATPKPWPQSQNMLLKIAEMHRFKAILFDLDGTLVDSAPDIRAAINRVLARKGRRPLDLPEVVSMIGDGAPKLVERAFRRTGEPYPADQIDVLTQVFVDFYDGHGSTLTRVFPGVVQALKSQKEAGVLLGICTNKPQGPTEQILEGLGLAPFIDASIGGDVLPKRKPDASHPLAVLNKLGVTPADAVMVGDSPNDVNAGKNAGLPTIAVSFGYTRVPPPEMGADILIDHFDELQEALSKLT